MISYITLCIVSILAGLGILRLIGIKFTPSLSLCLSPVMTLSFWSIFLGIGILSGITVSQLWLTGWTLTLVLVIIGINRENYNLIKKEWFILITIIVLPMMLMMPYFLHGLLSYPGSPLSDGWAYTAYGKYLWKYVRGTEGGLPPLYQYAAHLAQSRFTASALLGFFSPIAKTIGDTQISSNLFLAWSVFVFSSACMFFANTQKLGRFKIFYLILVILSGWMVNVLWTNNYDNLLILCFLPTFAGVTTIILNTKFQYSIVLGSLMAAAIYCYPEMVIFVALGSGLFLLHRILSDKNQSLKRWVVLILLATILAIILTAPFLNQAYHYIVNQFMATLSSSRPGEGYFPDLLNPYRLISAYWSLKRDILSILLSIFLTGLAIFGLLKLLKQKQWGLFTIAVMLILGSMIMIFYYHYSYGAYKFILLNLWLLSFAVIIATKYIINICKNRPVYYYIVIILLTSLFVLFVTLNVKISFALDKRIPIKNMSYYKNITAIKTITEKKPIMLHVNDPIANEWAVYYLQDIPLYVVGYRAYMAAKNIIPFMKRSKSININDIHYMLTDNKESLPKSNLLWSKGPYYLWKLTKNWIFIGNIQNNNGLEVWKGKLGFWIGPEITDIELISNYKCQIIFSAKYSLGPSSSKSERHLLFFTDHGYSRKITINKTINLAFILPMTKGNNHIFLKVLDKPNIMSKIDPHLMLIRIWNLKVRLK